MPNPAPEDSIYNHQKIEKEIYNLWLTKDLFKYQKKTSDKKTDPYVMIMPPPNITGRLHMGHALNNTIQDILIRYRRMQGREVLWVPGTDHAGIATQTIVKKELVEQGIDYRKLGRKKFSERTWQWKDKYGNIILEQLKKLGISCDWENTKFTLSPAHSKVVDHAFGELYRKGLIYKGKRIVNWCPVDQTALSDDEIETVQDGEKGHLWSIKYFLENSTESLIVATTRPETLFGDVAIAVHPADQRYKNLIGKKVIVPLQNRVISVIADDYVDKDFGTGCLKITPAHDPNDFDLAVKYNLPMITVMNEDATMNEVVPHEFRGLSREKCRQKVLEKLKEQQVLVKEEPRMVPWGRSYRSGVIIEYRLSDQWFIKMSPLVEKTVSFKDQLHFHPQRLKKVYDHWLANIRDWCISRQIWWGHRIPAWYCDNDQCVNPAQSPQPLVALTKPSACPHCRGTDLRQEEDVLDTWFSSSLWPMSTLGWLQKDGQAMFEKYFPSNALSTAKDIIFFWVARMVMMSIFFQKKLPFTDVYFHPTVMDSKGKVMSKSKGNGIDPLHVIAGATCEDLKVPIYDAKPKNSKQMLQEIEKKYPDGFIGVGADALRYTLIYLLSSGQELHLSFDSFIEIGRRFTTKLWNVSRLLILSLQSLIDEINSPSNNFTTLQVQSLFAQNSKNLPSDLSSYEDQWIDYKCHLTIAEINRALIKFDFAKLGLIYYDFVWHDLCDWYVEMIKGRLHDENLNERAKTVFFFLQILQNTLKLIHPLIPFMTEKIWQNLNHYLNYLGIEVADENLHLMQVDFPVSAPYRGRFNQKEMSEFAGLKTTITAIRSLKKRYNIKEKENLTITLQMGFPFNQTLRKRDSLLKQLARVTIAREVKEKPKNDSQNFYSVLMGKEYKIFVNIGKFIDLDLEKKRLHKSLAKIAKNILQCERKLQNEKFIQNAKSELVQKEREHYSQLKNQKKQLLQELDDLS